MPRLAPLVIVALLVGSFVGSVALVDPPMPGVGRSYPDPDPAPAPGPEAVGPGFTTFESVADFHAYLNASQRRYAVPEHRRDGGNDTTASPAARTTSDPASTTRGQSVASDHALGSRRSNVVAVGDSHVYYGHGSPDTGRTSVFDVSPPEHTVVAESLSQTGRVFRVDDTLVVLGPQAVTGYDISAPADPEPVWNRSLAGDVVTAQHRNGTLFLVLETAASTSACPVEPLDGATTPCADIYHPTDPVPADSIYTVVRLDPASGRVQDTASLIGSPQSTVSIAENGIYLTTTEPTPRGRLLLDFLLTDARSLLPVEVVGQLERLRGSKMSDRESYTSARQVLDEWLSSLSVAEQRVLDHRLDMRYRSYVGEHRQSLQTTYLARLHEDTLAVAASGTVPGVPVGQASLADRAGRFRIATTVRPSQLRWGPVRPTTGVYVLDVNLDVIGSTTGLQYGRTPVVQFAGETALVGSQSATEVRAVTLSDPENPRSGGTVSTTMQTLYPMSADRFLGVGTTDDQVSVTLVDVSNPANPQVTAHRMLPAAQADSGTDRPVLLATDSRRLVLRTATGVHVLTRSDLSTAATATIDQPRDAIFLDDHLYVFGRDVVVVVNKSTWRVTRRVRL